MRVWSSGCDGRGVPATRAASTSIRDVRSCARGAVMHEMYACTDEHGLEIVYKPGKVASRVLKPSNNFRVAVS